MISLPPAFELIPKLLLILDEPDADCDELVDVIRVDAGLTTQVVRMANAAAFAHSYRSETLRDAAIRLGIREIVRITTRTIASPFLRDGSKNLDLWTHSIAVAVACREISLVVDRDTEIAFTAGLLHDLGKIVFAQKHGMKYTDVVETCLRTQAVVHDAERARFGCDHAQAGAALLDEWNFPESLVNALCWHHAPGKISDADRVMPAIAHVGNALAYRLGHGFGSAPEAALPDPAALEVLGISPFDVTNLEEATLVAFDREREAISRIGTARLKLENQT
jgi:putative nucleotidyltransferase with HDIG domain